MSYFLPSKNIFSSIGRHVSESWMTIKSVFSSWAKTFIEKRTLVNSNIQIENAKQM